MLLGNEHGMVTVDSSNTMQLDSSADGTHWYIYITVSFSCAIVLFCSYGNSRHANARHNIILYVHCSSCWTLNLGFRCLTCVCVCVCVCVCACLRALYTSSVEQVCNRRDRRKAIRHDSIYLVNAEFILGLHFGFKRRRCYRNILNVCPITRLYLSSAVASVAQ